MMKPRKQPIRIPAPQAQAVAMPASRRLVSDDLRLFAMTFAGGFVFTTLFIA